MNNTLKLLALTLLAPLLAISCGSPSPSSTSPTGANTPLRALATARLTTPWTAAALAAPVPLPEYPRPQLTRPDWLNLNGKWSLNAGSLAPSAENPPATAPGFPANPEQILVPYPVESYLSGVQRPNQRNMWYKRSFAVPANWSGKRVILNFGAVDRVATIYVNGQKIGSHSGGYDAFSFDITPALRSGGNELVVGVFDPTDNNDMRGKQTTSPGGIFYTATSGIWQTVWLEPVAAPHITRLDLTPDVSGKRLRVTVQGEGLGGQTVEALVAGGAAATGTVGTEFTIPMPNARLWSPDDPFLYDLKVRLRSGNGVVDEVGSYFGMRSISVGTVGGVPRPLLNGKFVFQTGTLDQGFWPDGLYTAPTDEALKSDLVAHKDLGFNMVRKHIKVEPQRWFYWADKLGLLVWQDMPSTSDGCCNPSAATQARFQAQAREIVDEHRSSPSVVTWVVFNESWGDFDVARVTNLVKSWDASRLVDGHSGINWNPPGDSGAGELIDVHDYPGPIVRPFQPGRPAVLGEYGGNCLKVAGHMWNTAANCPYTTYPDQITLTNVYVEQVNGLRELAASQGLSAAVYTEISDVEDELNGFLTYDRQVKKMDFARVRAANQALIDGVPLLRIGAALSLKSASDPSRSLRHFNSLGFTEVASGSSPELLKKDASWNVVPGLADADCLSFEAINVPGSFLRHQNFRLRIDPLDVNGSFREDATFCARAALDGSGGLSLEAKNRPGQYVHRRGNEVWIDALSDTASFRSDASWTPVAGLWRSSVLLPLNEPKSLRVLTPGFDNRFARHSLGLGFTEVVNAGSDAGLEADATWKLVPGLADASCYSFESRNFPGEYLRHFNSRISRAALNGTSGLREDATFCTVSAVGGGVRFAAYAFPNRFLRHYDAQLWIADGLGGDAWNTGNSFADDIRWAVEAPWAP